MRACLFAACLLIAAARPAYPVSLKQMYEEAPAAEGYDKYIVLETGVTYTGGLWLGGTFNRITAEFDSIDEDVRIVGAGAVLDLQGGEICIAYSHGRLDIDDCVILNGAVRFLGYDGDGSDLKPGGSVRYVTFYKPHDYAVRLFGSGDDVAVERCLAVDAVDTGSDYMFLNGYFNDWLPTGANFAGSQTNGFELYENWSYHSEPSINSDARRHFVKYCDYG